MSKVKQVKREFTVVACNTEDGWALFLHRKSLPRAFKPWKSIKIRVVAERQSKAEDRG